MSTATLPDLADGIYFRLPDDIYFALPRLSNGGIQNMLVSPATFWAKSWLNPAKAEALAAAALLAGSFMAEADMSSAVSAWLTEVEAEFPDADKESKDAEGTKAQQLGKAYHTARLEPHLLETRFARQPERADFPGCAVWTGTDIEKMLAALEQPKTKAGEVVAEKAQRLADAGYQGTIFPLEDAKFKAALDGRIPIPGSLWDDMIADVARMRMQPEVADLITGGAAEVTVLYTSPLGIPSKCRFDMLKAASWADLKTFDNSRGKHLTQAILDFFRFNRLHVTAAVYREAAELMRGNALPIVGDATEAEREVVARIAIAPAELDCWFVFQEKNGVPNILARRARFFDVPQSAETQAVMMENAGYDATAAREAQSTKTGWFMRASGEIRRAREIFIAHHEIFRRGQPWLPTNAIGEIDDLDFPQHWLEGRDFT